MKRLYAAASAALVVIVALLIANPWQSSGPTHGFQTRWGVSAHSPSFGLPPKGAPRLAQVAPSVTPTVAMYDSITVSALPANAPAVAGYTGGFWRTFYQLAAAFPRAHRIPVAPNIYSPTFGPTTCLDVEPGDAVPSQAGPWDLRQLKLGRVPCDYSDLAEMPAIKASIAANGIARSRVLLWDADWTFVPHLDVGYDGTQWTDHWAGRNVDASIVTDHFLGITPPPPPVPLPVCFTHQMTVAQCKAVKAKVASDLRAVAASQQALDNTIVDLASHSCLLPYRRGVCRADGRAEATFIHRVEWFLAAAVALETSS